MFKRPVYVFRDCKISFDRDEVEQWVADNVEYWGEEGLMSLFENEVFELTTLQELNEWCLESGIDIEDLFEYGIDIERSF